MLDSVCDLDTEIYFLGDLNIDWSSNNCSLKNKLQSIADTCNLSQVVTKPTRIFYNVDGTKTETCLDLLFTNATNLCSKAISICVGFSDHNLIAINRKTKIIKPGQKIIIKRMFKHFNEASYCADIRNTDWSQVLEEVDPELALKVFTDLLMPIVDKHAPLRRMTVRNIASPWLDAELKEYMKKRDQLKSEASLSRDIGIWERYKQLRNFVTKLNRTKKRIYYEHKFEEAKLDRNKLWNTLNQLTGRRDKSVPTFLDVGDTFLTKPSDIANFLGNYFTKKVQNLQKDMISQEHSDLSFKTIKDTIMLYKSCTFKFDRVSLITVENTLKLMKYKPPGVDELDVKLLKMVADVITKPICYIINLSLEKCVFPDNWKKAKIVPLPKNKKENFSGKNSRPISILPILSKITEKIVYDQINLYFSKNKLNSPYQHAYKKGHSTTTALVQMTDDWLQEFDERKLVGTVMLDLSAAFDLIDHDLLLDKLRCYGFEKCAIQWIHSYLTDRKFNVLFNGSYSDTKVLRCGVPQGSCLGPLLFSIFINDLSFILKRATIALYADDLTIFLSDYDSTRLNTVLNNELQLIEKWNRVNKLKINVGKSKCMMLGSNHLLKDSPVLNLSVGGLIIEQVAEAKLLGVIVDSRLTWNAHIKLILNKMGRSMATVRHCRKCIPFCIRKTLVESIVLCHLDYCSIIWASTTENNLHKLQIAQNKACRLVLNCSFRTSVRDMHNQLAWLHVRSRINYSLIKFLKNIIISKAPEIIYGRLTFFSDVHIYSTRQSSEGRFLLPVCRTNQLQRTSCYRAVVAWNSLPLFLVSESHNVSFSKRLRLYLFTLE